MTNYRPKPLVFPMVFLLLAVGSASRALQPQQEQPPDDVRGNWTIYSKNIDNGQTVAKSVQINQNGNRLSGHFKGPYQSGGIEGTMNVRHIVFRTKTRNVLTFRGMVDGNTMEGNFGVRGHHGTWEGRRAD